MSLYQHPEIYAALLYAEADLIEDVEEWIAAYLEGPFRRLMDPACGPGTWLVPFAEKGLITSGNDREPAMIAEAARLLQGYETELRVGDMRKLSFRSGPFDVAINLHASVGHLPDDAAVLDHLHAVARNLRPGGLYLLGLTISDGDRADDRVDVLFKSKPTRIPSGGMAAVLYESVRRDPVARRERIRIHLLTKGISDCPGFLREEYDLLTFPAVRMRELLDESGLFDLLAAHAMSIEERPDLGLVSGAGDLTLVLRRRERAPARRPRRR